MTEIPEELKNVTFEQVEEAVWLFGQDASYKMANILIKEGIKSNKSEKRLAAIACIHRFKIAKLKTGEAELTFAQFVKLCMASGVSIDKAIKKLRKVI